MTLSPSPDQDPPRKKPGAGGPAIFMVACLITGLLGIGAWLVLRPGPYQPPARSGREENRQSAPAAKVAQPVQPVRDLSPRNTEPSSADSRTSSETTADQNTEPTIQAAPPAAPPPSRQERCLQTGTRLHDFFMHLDREEYFQEFNIDEPSERYFIALAKKLLDTPPVVSRETDDLYTMLRNMAHFFRVIGGRNITIIKTILDRERDKIEDVAADLYQWTTVDQCEPGRFSFQAPLDKLYEYAGFFLGSMGGRSYLFRRDSRSRLLVNYYAILLVDRANREKLNRHGIDLTPLIPQTIREIEGSNQLIYKEKYMDTLYDLEERYPRPGGQETGDR